MDTDNTELTSNGTCIQRHTVNTKYRKSRLFFKIMKYPRNNNCTQLIQFYGLITEDLYVDFSPLFLHQYLQKCVPRPSE